MGTHVTTRPSDTPNAPQHVPEHFHVEALTCSVSHVRNSSLVDALEELRAEYDTVSGEVAEMQNRLAAMQSRLDRLRDAIRSLERLGEPGLGTTDEPADDGGRKQEREVHRFDHGLTSGVDVPAAEPELDTEEGPAAAVIPESSPIAKYLARGGEGRRLRSTQMVADVVDEVDKVISRDELKVVFFQHFPREEMERLWDRADNAFGNALARAVKEKLIRRDKRGDVDVYASHAVVKRLREEREAANSEADEED